MTQNFTLNQITRLVYNETTPAESSMLFELMDMVPELKTEYKNLKEGKELLEKLKPQPSESSVENILKYSALKTPEIFS